ncbi:MAG: hypothetical protein OEY80_11405 [Nitrospirota bacterium]|nr:hypothetical protein [Nitrospirota bacterium]MDH4359848.1 hypothetical protein [Nitrospirota bacterium]MDH5296652.1 hypothetical protein [Nitrospirota bacterium]MDH5576083.1 hypothetical protein [Nitrospirota bacterium]
MQVQLDEEVWEVSDSVQLGEVLANVSDRARAKGCLVTELMVGNQKMTDRELVPPTLGQVASTFGSITAVSKRLETIVQYSEETGRKFGQQLCLKGEKFVDDFRQGQGIFRQLDQWFGQMADYLEWLQIHESVGLEKPDVVQDLSFWVNELTNAREIEDEVRVADMLEYEVLPRLSRNITSPM